MKKKLVTYALAGIGAVAGLVQYATAGKIVMKSETDADNVRNSSLVTLSDQEGASHGPDPWDVGFEESVHNSVLEASTNPYGDRLALSARPYDPNGNTTLNPSYIDLTARGLEGKTPINNMFKIKVLDNTGIDRLFAQQIDPYDPNVYDVPINGDMLTMNLPDITDPNDPDRTIKLWNELPGPPPVPPAYGNICGDDQKVDMRDLECLAEDWLTTNPRSDLFPDNWVDCHDFSELATYWEGP